MADWEFQVRRVVIESQADDVPADHFRVEVEDGYEPIVAHRNEALASGLRDELAYEIVFARRV